MTFYNLERMRLGKVSLEEIEALRAELVEKYGLKREGLFGVNMMEPDELAHKHWYYSTSYFTQATCGPVMVGAYGEDSSDYPGMDAHGNDTNGL